MPSRGIYVESMKELVKSDKPDDILFVFLRVCGDVEGFLFEKLFWEKEIEMELIENWTLGRLIEWNYKLDLINEESNKFLQDFCFLRNQMFHERLMFVRAKESNELLECIKNATIKAIDFLERNMATYKNNMKLERKYSDYAMDQVKIMDRIKSRFLDKDKS